MGTKLQSISHSCVEKVKPKRSHKSCSPPTKRSHVPKRFKSHGKVSSHSKIRQKKKVKPGVPCTHRYVRSNSRWLPNAIATETLPPVRKRSLKALPRQTNSFSASNIKSTNYTVQEGFHQLRNDPEELGLIYCRLRNKTQSILSDVTSTRQVNCRRSSVGKSRDERTVSNHHVKRKSSSQVQKKKKKRGKKAIKTGEVIQQMVTDMVDSVCLQPAIQSLKRRISEIRISRRPTPVSVDPDVLGTELKVRLAAVGHNLRSDVKPSTGRYVFNNHSRIHQVALHEISDEQDCSVMCYMKVPQCSVKCKQRSKVS